MLNFIVCSLSAPHVKLGHTNIDCLSELYNITDDSRI